ncbi:MAG: hypothetical protein DHS20C07_22640 [Methyloligella sp.]|nr:MAG: hypothetical protein DHS20C07_22640 [Methyloligella sp.]
MGKRLFGYELGRFKLNSLSKFYSLFNFEVGIYTLEILYIETFINPIKSSNAHLTSQIPNGYGGYYEAHGER